MHGIEQMKHMDIFYHGMNYSSKETVDAASGGAFRRKKAEEATQLIEALATIEHHLKLQGVVANTK